MLQCALRLPWDVDLSLFQALDQIVGREINKFDGVSAIEHRIRNSFAYADVSYLGDNVVQAFNVLDIYRGIDIDAMAQQLFDVQVAFRMTAPECIGVGEFIDQDDLRPAGDDGIEVHLLQQLTSVLDALAGNDLQTF